MRESSRCREEDRKVLLGPRRSRGLLRAAGRDCEARAGPRWGGRGAALAAGAPGLEGNRGSVRRGPG